MSAKSIYSTLLNGTNESMKMKNEVSENAGNNDRISLF